MSDDPRVEHLLDELCGSDALPEEVCGSCPELLPAVRERLRQMRRVEDAVDALFPSPIGPDTGGPPSAGDGQVPPTIPGYAIEAVLGRGGMGVVYRARHLALKRTVALKTLAAGHSSPADRARFRAEAEAVARLQHPNIVQIYEIGEAGGRPFFALEFVAGGSLAGRLAGRPLPPRDVARLTEALADAMHLAHSRNLIHRDLKPANVLLAEDGTPRITDFGLVRRLDDDSGQTWAGTLLGTPAYMAPEQAEGRAHAAGPPADLYALGVILYECLTGRPPFRGATPLETLEQVRGQEPAAPSSLNRQVPRDIETICLKCLRKEPDRRYSSARELADDLRRFLDGKPVRARPIGAAERAVKWARRRPAAALLVAALAVMAAASAGAGLWLRQQEADRQAARMKHQDKARNAIETALTRADDLRRVERWPEGLLVLNEAFTHLAEAGSLPLENRLRQAQSDFQTAADLARVRESGPLDPNGFIDYAQWATEYRQAFERGGLRDGDDQDALAASLKTSAIRDQLVAALDERAYVAFRRNDRPLVERLLRIARSADPEPRWGDRFRDPAVWQSRERLEALAGDAYTAAPPPPGHQLALLGRLLTGRSSLTRITRLLGEACRRQPDSYWIHHEMGAALSAERRYTESAGHFRAALALRPDNAEVYVRLSVVLFALGQTEDCLAANRRAVELSPASRSARYRLVCHLAEAGYWKEADAECRRALEIDADNRFVVPGLLFALRQHHREEDLSVLCRKVIATEPNDANANYGLAEVFRRANRHFEAATALRKLAQLSPANAQVRGMLAGELIAAGRWGEAITELQTGITQVPGTIGHYKDLGTLLRAQGRPEEAAAAFRKAADLDPLSPWAWDGLAAALLDQGRFGEARAAIGRLLELPATPAGRRTQQRQLELCDALLAVKADLPAILAGKERPTKVVTQHALAAWCLKHRRLPATAAGFYEMALAAQPSLADDPELGTRSEAACAAALAGSGVGADAAKLDGQRRAVLRGQSLDWLKAEYNAWAARHRRGMPGDRTVAATAVRSWLRNDDLAVVRGAEAIARLPPAERAAWQTFWDDVAALAARDPVEQCNRAQGHVSRREWGEAAACYASTFELEPTDDGGLWFEYAAAQLLAEDRPGYRRTCAHMLARCRATPHMRPYLVARACTLAPNSTDDLAPAARLSANELLGNQDAFWSLIELAALHFRAGRVEKAVPLLERSLVADGRTGRAVLNWLWLALAFQRLGNADEARRWLDKAVVWLDQQEGRMPLETTAMGLHRHNWLEAHLLRREAEALLR